MERTPNSRGLQRIVGPLRGHRPPKRGSEPPDRRIIIGNECEGGEVLS